MYSHPDFNEEVGVPDSILQDLINADGAFDFEKYAGSEPKLEILVQPKQRGYRFRYVSEGHTHGGIPGQDACKGKKTYPTIQIQNYSGKAAICICLVSAEDPTKVHAHNLVGKNVHNGMYYAEFDKKQWVLNIQNLGIQHVTKKDLEKVLYEKLLQGHQMNLFVQSDKSTQSFDISELINSFGPTKEESVDPDFKRVIEDLQKENLKREAEVLAKTIDLSSVKLLIQAFLPDEKGNLTKAIPAVISDPIYDAKAAHAGQLRICRLSKPSSSVAGGEEVFLLCDKVQKDDIIVRFYREDKSGNVTWEDKGKFSPTDVHKQTAIVFKTPPYEDRAIQKPITVKVQLKRKKDGECSEPCDFVYRPEEFDRYKIGEKRRKDLPENLDSLMKGNPAKRPNTSTSSPPKMKFLGQTTDFSGIKFFQQQ